MEQIDNSTDNSTDNRSKKTKMTLGEFHMLCQKKEKSEPKSVAFSEPKSRDDVSGKLVKSSAESVTEDKVTEDVSEKTLKNRKKRQAAKERKKNAPDSAKGWTASKKTVERANIRRPYKDDVDNSINNNSMDNIEQIEPNRTIILKNLPATVKDKDLRHFFKKIGSIKNVNVIRKKDSNDCKGIAFITFYSIDDASKAITKLNKFWYEDNQVYLDYAYPLN